MRVSSALLRNFTVQVWTGSVIRQGVPNLTYPGTFWEGYQGRQQPAPPHICHLPGWGEKNRHINLINQSSSYWVQPVHPVQNANARWPSTFAFCAEGILLHICTRLTLPREDEGLVSLMQIYSADLSDQELLFINPYSHFKWSVIPVKHKALQ